MMAAESKHFLSAFPFFLPLFFHFFKVDIHMVIVLWEKRVLFHLYLKVTETNDPFMVHIDIAMDLGLSKLPARSYLYAGMMMHTCTQKATAGVSKA